MVQTYRGGLAAVRAAPELVHVPYGALQRFVELGVRGGSDALSACRGWRGRLLLCGRCGRIRRCRSHFLLHLLFPRLLGLQVGLVFGRCWICLVVVRRTELRDTRRRCGDDGRRIGRLALRSSVRGLGHLRARRRKRVRVAFCCLLDYISERNRLQQLGRGTGLDARHDVGVELFRKLSAQLVRRPLAFGDGLSREDVELLRKLQGVPADVDYRLARLVEVAGDLLLLRTFARVAVCDDIPHEKAGDKADSGDGDSDHAKHLAGDASFFRFRRRS